MSEQKVVEAVEKAIEADDHLIELSSGVLLRGKKANPLVLIRVMAAFPRPKPPVWMNKAFGREMENPDDPEYQSRLKAWEMEQSNATLNAMILLGTELVSKPKKFPGPDDDEWLEEYSLLNVPMEPQNKRWRYLTWVMFKAVNDEKDLMRIQEVVGKLSGVRESAVQDAENFPGSE